MAKVIAQDSEERTKPTDVLFSSVDKEEKSPLLDSQLIGNQ
jgi:hypothetical protein